MATTDPVAALAEATRQMNEETKRILDYEQNWIDKQAFLQSRGYMLRARYRPGWRPSWEQDPTLDPFSCDDFWRLPYFPSITDATRIADGRLVCIKRVTTDGQELLIANYFSTGPLREDPKNHCVPVIDSFRDEETPEDSYIVMPFMRNMDDPPFELVTDVLEFADEVLEGIAFMHAHGVAHRDPAPSNILMDADSMYPKGYHPVFKTYLPNFRTRAWPYSRFSAPAGVRYYLADFGISARFAAGQQRLVSGEIGADREVPELHSGAPYDPFKVDIFVLGNVFKKRIHDKYFRVGFFAPLITAMMQHNPQNRPDATEALAMWQKIRRRVLLTQRLCRLQGRDEALVQTVVLDIASVIKVAYVLAKRFAGWSLRWLLLLIS
ncbi:kinase-like domain-containing protein [Phanerochaete sordida]|uniref:Kinase-like domain-containing protein n=1 Tax=Phanerochaete sordida TaxID=48140 RepID=A0A9P3GF26_9APHY|nr:kinase-like domain-containing protein [Phanerochaete sordida]